MLCFCNILNGGKGGTAKEEREKGGREESRKRERVEGIKIIKWLTDDSGKLLH